MAYANYHGTSEEQFQIGLSGVTLLNDAETLKLVKDDGVTLTNVTIAEPVNQNHAATRKFSRERCVKIDFSFDGSSAPAAGANTDKYGLCHTSGGAYTAGVLYFDDGTNLVAIAHDDSRLAVNRSGAFSGTVSMLDDHLYIYDVTTDTWTAVGPFDESSLGAVKAVKVDATTSTSSSSVSIPSGSVVVKASLDITTSYPVGTTIELGTSTTPSLFMASNKNRPWRTRLYIVEQMTPITTSAPLTVTIGGSPASGASSSVVLFSTALI